MIITCSNPGCRKELRDLGDGRVVRVLRKDSGRPTMFLWLCGECCMSHCFEFGVEGTPSVVEKEIPLTPRHPFFERRVA